VDSGGDPDVIPQLSYEDFKAFHADYYHPSNCRIFLYGNIPSERSLEFLDRRFLSSFDRKEVASGISLQKSWDKPRTMETGWPLGESESEEGKSTISLNWKIFPFGDAIKTLSMSILSEMLMGNAGAPLYKAILQSGLGEDLSPVSGVDFDLAEGAFSVGLRGSDPDRAEAFQELVYRTLGDIAEEGFDRDLMESCMRRVEFRAREIQGGGPFGLRLLRKVMKGWNYGQNPGDAIRFDSVMEELRTLSVQKGYFESLLKEWIIENRHMSRVTVKPDRTMARHREEALRKELADLAAAMSDRDKQELEEKNRALKEFQEAEDEGSVPFLATSDIPSKVKTLTVDVSADGPAPVLSQKVFTNGILYNDMAFSLGELEDELFLYLPLFCKYISGTGLPGVPYDRVATELALKTGGFGVSVEAGHKVGDLPGEKPESFLYLRMKMLEAQCGEALELAASLMRNADFDNHERMEQILLELWNDLKSSLLPGGHSYVMIRGGSRFSSSARREDLMYGIGQLQFLEALKEREGHLDELSRVMKSLRQRIFRQDNLTLSIVGDEDILERQGDDLRAFWRKTLEAGADASAEVFLPATELPASAPALKEAEGLAIASMVGYVGKTIRGADMESQGYIRESLLSQLMKTGPLWEKIRMKGGAYGAFSSNSGLDRTFTFATYRDPEIGASLDAFRESLEEFSGFDDAEELDKAVISVAGKELKPQSPSEKSMIALKRRLYNITDPLRQQNRDRLLACGCDDVADSSRALLSRWDEDGITVMGHPERLDEAAGRWPGLKDNRVNLPQ
jgi:Zn-dependent M16 (insulinase) family peptidase